MYKSCILLAITILILINRNSFVIKGNVQNSPMSVCDLDSYVNYTSYLEKQCLMKHIIPYFCSYLKSNKSMCLSYLSIKFNVPFQIRAVDIKCGHSQTYLHDQSNSPDVTLTHHNYHFSPHEMVSMLYKISHVTKNTRRGVLFSGDSMTRQLMMRLIYYIRGNKIISEYIKRGDILYILYSTHDRIYYLNNPTDYAKVGHILMKFYPNYYRSTSTLGDENLKIDDILFTLLYIKKVKPDPNPSWLDMFDSAPLHISSLMYHWNKQGQVSVLDPFFSKVNSILNSTYQHFIWLTTPALNIPH